MSRVLLIGNGAREHAIAAALHKSGAKIWSLMARMNPGIDTLSERSFEGNLGQAESIPNLEKIDYAIVGPEAPLAEGLVDRLETRGISAVGPSAKTARLETSKVYARLLLQSIQPEANPRFQVVKHIQDLDDAIDRIGLEDLVIKPDGLTGGKGVKLFAEHVHSRDEVLIYAEKMIRRDGSVIFEEKMRGTEFTVQVLVDANGTVESMPLVRDFKRAYDGDIGPNTGSMGSYSRESHGLGYVTKNDLDKSLGILKHAIRGVKENTGESYKGILYGQFMKTPQGIKVIEFNARFGDPEAMNVLSILDSSMDEICHRILDGTLKRPSFLPLATVCVYIVPEGYPGNGVESDQPISIRGEIGSELYYASVYERNGTVYTTGSRAIALLGKGHSVREARTAAYEDIDKIEGRIRYRSDIAANV